jgi:acyl-CoA thioesterase II
VGDFAADTAVTGSGGRYVATLAPDWQVWGPLGGYVAAIGLRALGAEAELPRPASFSCQFLSFARFAEVELEVSTLRRGRRSQALQVLMRQERKPVLAGQGWFVDAKLEGYEHVDAVMPRVAMPEALQSYEQLADNYDEWYPLWTTRTVDAKPLEWGSDEPGPPVWQTWMRLVKTPPLDDPVLEAARSLMWLDLMMWNASTPPHRPWPLRHLAPNLDVSALFHGAAPREEWLLCDAHSPVASEGLVGCHGRVWARDGRLLASGTSQLLCVPNAQYEEQLLQRQQRERS